MSAPQVKATSLRSIIPPDGSPRTATATRNLHNGENAFAIPRDGNKVKAFTTGKDYFSDLLIAISAATETVYIAGWQVNWDARVDEENARVFDVLLHAAKSNVNLKIYVMPWDDTAPIQTFDDQTKAALEIINEILGRKCVYVVLANAKPDEFSIFYSHHQKQVVIDEKIAYVGGMDLCYGRLDDEHFDLLANAKGRASLNRYNGCICPMEKLKENEVVNPDLLNGIYDNYLSNNRKNAIAAIQDRHIHQVPYEDDAIYKKNEHLNEKYLTLDPQTQPRMPWQDSHVKIVGPAAYDLTRNFVIRWNSSENAAGDKPKLKLPPMPPSVCTGTGCIVQVLRSAPRAMLNYEHLFTPSPKGEPYKPITGEQHNIADAMATLIEKSQHFIYIENQFFVSAFGQEGELDAPGFTGPAKQVSDQESFAIFGSRTQSMYDNDQQPKNKICEQLANRIDIEIKKAHQTPFHIYITLPVHPEGMLNNGTVMTQVHWTMQSLVFGSHSLLNRIRRYLYADKLRKQNDPNWEDAYKVGNNDYAKNIPLEACEKYVTLLNLRNWKNLGTAYKPRYVTEQIYVHNKLMIVDDRYVLVGSANINDRSLLGTRDSELSVLITDTATETVDLCGDGKKRPVRCFAREMRMAVWNKIFGITSGNRAATELAEAVLKPGAQKSWEAIRKVAAKNTKLYEAAFDFIPRNLDSKRTTDPLTKQVLKASIWPSWHAPTEKNQPWTQSGPMPFDEKFWFTPQFNPNEAFNLEEVKGFITLLPIEWTKGNKNNLGYSSPLLVQVPTKTRNA